MTPTSVPLWASHLTPTRYHQLCEVARKFSCEPHGVALLAGDIPNAREYVPKSESKRVKRGQWSDVVGIQPMPKKRRENKPKNGWHDFGELPNLAMSLDWLE